jgi:hypothetical protein
MCRVPALSAIGSGNSIKKYRLLGSWYLNFCVFVDTFFTLSFWMYSPPGAHVPPL